MFGARVVAGLWVGVWALVEAYVALVWIAGAIGLTETAASLAAVATIVVSVGAIGVAVRRAWRQMRRVGRAITTVLGLDEKLDEHRDESRAAWGKLEERLVAHEERTEAIERQLDTYASTERAAVSGALHAWSHPPRPRPRPSRATDPE